MKSNSSTLFPTVSTASRHLISVAAILALALGLRGQQLAPVPSTPGAASRPDAAMEASIGRLLRERREALGLTQQALAGQIGIAYQQLQRYERGTNSITAVRLHRTTAG